MPAKLFSLCKCQIGHKSHKNGLVSTLSHLRFVFGSLT